MVFLSLIKFQLALLLTLYKTNSPCPHPRYFNGGQTPGIIFIFVTKVQHSTMTHGWYFLNYLSGNFFAPRVFCTVSTLNCTVPPLKSLLIRSSPTAPMCVCHPGDPYRITAAQSWRERPLRVLMRKMGSDFTLRSELLGGESEHSRSD